VGAADRQVLVGLRQPSHRAGIWSRRRVPDSLTGLQVQPIRSVDTPTSVSGSCRALRGGLCEPHPGAPQSARVWLVTCGAPSYGTSLSWRLATLLHLARSGLHRRLCTGSRYMSFGPPRRSRNWAIWRIGSQSPSPWRSQPCHAFAEPSGYRRTRKDMARSAAEYWRTLEEPLGYRRTRR